MKRARRTLDRVLEIAARQPGVEAVAASTSLPFGAPYAGRGSFYAPGQPNPGFSGQRGMMIAATPGIFQVLGVRITRGRGFDQRDSATAPPVAVISEFTARQIFGSADTAVGREFVIDEPKQERVLAMVVGVASDTDVMIMLGDPKAFVYVPFTQRYESFAAITARASGKTSQAVAALRDALHAADPDLAVNVIGPGRSVLAGPFQLLRGFGYTTIGLGMLTLLLAMIGLFGIQTHIVARRTREIGVRISFGATPKQIRWMVISQGARPVIDGMLLGLAAGLVGRLFIRNYLAIINMEVIDVWAFVLIPIPLALASYCACYLPASRAAAVDPNVALRHL
jgi:putative ABC transport system permease protein